MYAATNTVVASRKPTMERERMVAVVLNAKFVTGEEIVVAIVVLRFVASRVRRIGDVEDKTGCVPHVPLRDMVSVDGAGVNAKCLKNMEKTVLEIFANILSSRRAETLF